MDQKMDAKDTTFYDLSIEGDIQYLRRLDLITNLKVENNLYLEQGILHDSTIAVLGDIHCNPSFGSMSKSHDTQIYMDATRQQNIISVGIIPKELINKPSNNQKVKVHGNSPLYINGDLIITDGTFNTNGVDLKIGVNY